VDGIITEVRCYIILSAHNEIIKDACNWVVRTLTFQMSRISGDSNIDFKLESLECSLVLILRHLVGMLPTVDGTDFVKGWRVSLF